MRRVPAASNDPTPAALAPAGAPGISAKVDRSPPAPRRLLGGVVASLAALTVMAALAFAYAEPSLAPMLVPIAALLGATALWGAARIDHLRLRSDLRRLAVENHRLAASLESLADTAWELRESEERYRSLIDAQGDLVVHRDAAGRVAFVNRAFARTFGLSAEALREKPLALVPLEEGADEHAGDRRDVEARDLKLGTVAGPRWYAWVDIRVRDDTGALGPTYSVARDITARKEVEAALVEARRKAEAASQAKSRFLATVSHEFRTPLNGILGLNGLLLETRLTPDQETYARGVQSSGEALLGLIDDMLDFSKIEAGRLDLRPEPTDLEAALQEIAELLAARAQAKGIDIAVSLGAGVPERVMVDATRLRQILINLVGNGVKFTETGGVTLSAIRTAGAGEGAARIVFAVADSGPGIAASEAERIFGEFEQIDTALTRRHGGTGLGLAISQRIVNRMGGQITLDPRPGGGSVFHFALDLLVLASEPPAAPVDLSGRRLLILAPSGAEAPVLAEALVRSGGAARIVGTTIEGAALVGAAAAAALGYDAVLIHSRVAPDPATALAKIREAAGRAVPAAILIEPGQRSEVEGLRAAGFDAYLVRPVRRSSLLRIVSEILDSVAAFRMDPSDTRPRLPGPARRAATSLEVLLAEDNEINALLARAVLEGLGHSVTEVRDGAAAVAAATEREGRFAAILMDLHMPGLDGIAAARAIRDFERRTSAPRAAILALTADVLAETRAEAEKAGIDALLEKPVAPDALRRALAEVTAA
jgi:PAS domain S-box-containing protein